MPSEISKLDSKGRLQIPSSFREFLILKPSSPLLVSLDEQNARLVLTPTSEKKLVIIKIEISDKPGSLAAAASALSKEGVDLVSSESHSMASGKSAEWKVICGASSVKDPHSIRKRLLSAGAKSVSIKRL